MDNYPVVLRDREGTAHFAKCSPPGHRLRVGLGETQIRPSTIYRLEQGGFVIENMQGELFGLHGRQYWLVEGND